jgi:hypothetical protein
MGGAVFFVPVLSRVVLGTNTPATPMPLHILRADRRFRSTGLRHTCPLYIHTQSKAGSGEAPKPALNDLRQRAPYTRVAFQALITMSLWGGSRSNQSSKYRNAFSNGTVVRIGRKNRVQAALRCLPKRKAGRHGRRCAWRQDAGRAEGIGRVRPNRLQDAAGGRSQREGGSRGALRHGGDADALKEAPAVLVFWRGQRTADAVDEAIAGHVSKDNMPSLAGGSRSLMRGPIENQVGLYGCG